MKLIPVLDIKAGQAVMAVGGERERYRPLATPLCRDGNVLRAVSSLLELGSFPVMYVADLDAIQGNSDNGIIIERIHQEFPLLHLWIDRGWPPISPSSNITPVIGSESLDQDWKSKLATLRSPWILSLDFNAQGYLGPAGLLKEPSWWPPSVILMSLAKVGTRSGPDWPRLTAFTQSYPNICWIAAGGISSPQDLERLKALGIQHALVATALHYGLIQGA
jgi:phosphoribosylformimino-5-aminoimidazole carboxamide ribotide isomerase